MITKFDLFGEMETLQLILTEISGERLGVINGFDVRGKYGFTNISSISFSVPAIDLDGNPSEVYDLVEELRLIETERGIFQIIELETYSDGIRELKQVTAYSAQVMLQQIQILNLEGELKLFDPIRPQESVLGLLLPEIPRWTIGNVDGSLLTKWRTVNITKQNLYALLTNDLSNLYEAIFVFDYKDFKIHVYDVEREWKQTSIFASFDNLVKNASIKVKTDDIKTKLIVRAANFDIAGVNPNSSDSIYNLNYYKNRMSPALLAALNAYEIRYASLRPTYSNLLLSLKNRNAELTLLNNNSPQYNVNFNANQDGTAQVTPLLTSASGLNQLDGLRRTLENIRSVRIEQGNIPYTDVNNIINQVEPLITSKRNAITAKENEITGINNQLRNIVDQLKMENNFTTQQWIELTQYFRHGDMQEDGLVHTDIMTQEEKQELQEELMEIGQRVLSRICYPKYEITMDSVNLLALKEFEYFHNQFELGSVFTLDVTHYIVKPLLLGVEINYDNLSDFKLIFANKSMLDEGFSLIDFNSDNVNTVTTISFDLVKLETMKRQSDEVTQILNGVWDASRNEVVSNPFQTRITINETGLRAVSYDWNTEQPTGDELRMTGRQIAMSDNGFMNSRLAIGRLTFPGAFGGSAMGIATEVLIGQIIAGNELHITNRGNNFRLDETGAWLDNANFTITRTQGGVTNRIELNPTEGFSIWRGNERQIYLDATTGDVVFRGTMNAGSININNQFVVNSNGHMVARSALITGTIESSTISGSTVIGSTIIGGSLDINNGAAHIDSSGVGYFRNIHITGGTQNIGSYDTGGNGFRVDQNGILYARGCWIDGDGFFSGTLRAATGTFNGVYTGTLSANQITTGSLISIDIQGARFWNQGRRAYMTVGTSSGGGNAADFGLYRDNGSEVFRVYDDFNAAIFRAMGTTFLDSEGAVTAPRGNWTFSNRPFFYDGGNGTGNRVGVVSLTAYNTTVQTMNNNFQNIWSRLSSLESRVSALES